MALIALHILLAVNGMCADFSCPLFLASSGPLSLSLFIYLSISTCIFQFELYFRWLFDDDGDDDDDGDGDFDNRRSAQSEKQITLGYTKSWLGIHLIHIQIGEKAAGTMKVCGAITAARNTQID